MEKAKRFKTDHMTNGYKLTVCFVLLGEDSKHSTFMYILNIHQVFVAENDDELLGLGLLHLWICTIGAHL